ncbi:ABC transporter substrate-binding protein [Belnapia rosea]|uniref:Peptide/nickel transport system substrate-binding protein n=1 Tax=Belnapia rosea TaxID=938405 RepID=A0A1G6S538_9PROT|nr:ABC transporter substrate-binding protein [Belnapia rosea]SDD11316.1 peptide/nickel transport system substrate-binding protein [Belnapia rosea]
MKITRRDILAGTAGLAAAPLAGPAMAQSRAETLRQVTGNTVNTLDPTMPGSTREAFGISVNIYDRLVSFGRKQSGAGWVFDPDTIRGELAERVETSADGTTFTFHLRRDAKFHDGTPVTAEDVKWSLDRHVSARSLAAVQIQTGSWTRAEQFRIIDQHTVEARVERPDRLALPNLCTLYCIIINSKVAKAHATAEDPWAQNWLKDNAAGSGAYMAESFKPGEQVILRRNDNWKGSPDGKLPFFRRIINQTIPEAATRANLIERGDADLSIDLQASDVPTLAQRPRVKVVSTPQFNAFTMVAFNTRMAPFDNIKLRQAVAAALPYGDIFKAALFERGAALFGADWSETPPTARFPQPLPMKTNLARARALMAEAGFPNGLDTTFSFNVGSAATSEPMAALIKESLARIGIRIEIQKLPDAQISTLVTEKKLPFLTETSIAWLPSTDYFFRNFFTGEQRWNYSSWNNAEITALTAKARFEQDAAEYDRLCRRMIAVLAEEVPLILLWQPNQDAVMTQAIDGYTYQYHRQVDYRDLRRA